MNITASPNYSNANALHVKKSMDTSQQQTASGCKACHARLVLLKKQTNKMMKNEYRKMIAGNTIPAVSERIFYLYFSILGVDYIREFLPGLGSPLRVPFTLN